MQKNINGAKPNENHLHDVSEFNPHKNIAVSLEQHHLWLHTSFVLNGAGKLPARTDALAGARGSNLRGRRVWCKRPVLDPGSAQLVCPANTGGTVAFHDQMGDMVVRWDNGQITMHHKDALLRMAYLIGRHQTLADHIDCLSNRCRCSG
jgi:hypothetical protein